MNGGEYPDKRPTMRGECFRMPRPCPFFSCKWHMATLFTGHSKNSGVARNYWENSTDGEVIDDVLGLPFTCILDACDRGDMTLEEVGQLMGMTRERVRQIEGLSHRIFRGKQIKLKGMAALRHPSKKYVTDLLRPFWEDGDGDHGKS